MEDPRVRRQQELDAENIAHNVNDLILSMLDEEGNMDPDVLQLLFEAEQAPSPTTVAPPLLLSETTQSPSPTTVSPTFLPRLLACDRTDILRNNLLSDDVIDGSMSLLQHHFPALGGLNASGAVMFMEPFPASRPGAFIQIINRSTPMSLQDMGAYNSTAGTHWLTLSNVHATTSNEVIIYDSYFGDLSASTKSLLGQLYSHHGGYTTRFEKVQKQPDSTSCGKWAIAYAFDLAMGQDPSSSVYEFGKMADHLISCFEDSAVRLFPGRKETWEGAVRKETWEDAVRNETWEGLVRKETNKSEPRKKTKKKQWRKRRNHQRRETEDEG